MGGIRHHWRLARLFLGAGALGVVTIAGCQLREPPPVNPYALQALERDAARGARFERLPPLAPPDYYLNPDNPDDPRNYDPGPYIQSAVERGARVRTGEVTNLAGFTEPPTPLHADDPAAPGARLSPLEQILQTLTTARRDPAVPRVISLPLREAMRRATLNNFDVAVAGFDPGIAETRVIEALARFDPTFQITGEYQDESSVNPAQSQFGDTQRLTLGTALSQLLPGGGEARLQYQAVRNEFETVFFPGIPNPSWTSELTLQITQPLLRDFGFDVNRARIHLNQNDQRISVLEFRNRLEEVLLQVEQTYWRLYQAQQEVAIQEELMRRTLETANRIFERGEHDATRDQIAQAAAAISLRANDMVAARTTAAQLSDQLKLLMNDPDLPITSPILIRPATPPISEPLLFDLETAIAVGLLNRPELSQQLLRINSASRAQRVAESNRLPRLDAIFRGGFGGFDEDYTGAVEDQFDFDSITVGLGLQLEIPIGNRVARAILRRTRMQRQQSLTQYQALVQQVTFEVKQTQRAAASNYARLRHLREAYLNARDAVESIEALERGGAVLSPEFSDRKLRFLESAARAQSLEAQALSDYNFSLAEYERAKGTLLRYNNIVLEEAGRQMRLPVGR